MPLRVVNSGFTLLLCLAVHSLVAVGAWGADSDLVIDVPGPVEFDSAKKSVGETFEDEMVPGSVLAAREPRLKPLGEYNRPGAGGMEGNDRGIDSADVKWRRQARTTGVRMRMLNGPELAYAGDYYSSDTERGTRNYLGAVAPINTRWEFAALDKFGYYKLKEGGRKAGIEALTLRVGANPSVSFRPWFALTPYMGLWDGDGSGVGISGGAEKNWGGVSLEAGFYAFMPWDEGYDTAVQDGRRHGVEAALIIPVDRRLTLTARGGYEWLETGPNARGVNWLPPAPGADADEWAEWLNARANDTTAGRHYAGRRGNWAFRADWIALKRDDAYMGYGFREQTLWDEQLVPTDFGFWGEISGERYIRPENFTNLNPTPKTFIQRGGIFYNQAISPHLGFNMEGYVGQDNARNIDFGKLYGVTLRLTMVVNPRFRMWFGWGYDSNTSTMEGEGGPESTFNFGMNCNF